MSGLDPDLHSQLAEISLAPKRSSSTGVGAIVIEKASKVG
jgi:hypothetical protein